MNGVVFSKTVLGTEELQQRQMRLHPRVRSLLVMVDGKQPADQLVAALAAAGVTAEHLQQLREAGLIEPVSPAQAATPQAGNVGLLSELPQQVSADESSRKMSLYRIYGEVIRTAFGPKGASLQKKLDAAASIADYFTLGNEIIVALNQSQRVEQAAEFKSRVKPHLRGAAA